MSSLDAKDFRFLFDLVLQQIGMLEKLIDNDNESPLHDIKHSIEYLDSLITKLELLQKKIKDIS